MSLPTQCKRGHEYTAETTRYTSRGARYCNACRIEMRRAKASKASAAEVVPDERWAPIPGFPGRYEISDQGRVLSRVHPWNPRILKASPNSRGYLTVTLYLDGEGRHELVHQLVAQAFCERADGHTLVRHLDDDPSDNRATNLAWGTDKDNAEDMRRNGGHFSSQKTHCPSGHPYNPENTGWVGKPTPHRYCRTCNRESARRQYLKRKAVA